LVQGVLLLTVVLFSLSLAPLPKSVKPVFKTSVLTPPFVHLGEAALQGSRQVFDQWR
jgi:hypothetical protein